MKTPLHISILRHLLAAGFALVTCSGFALVAAETTPTDTGPRVQGADPAPAVTENAATATSPESGPGAKATSHAHPRLTLADVRTALAGLTGPWSLERRHEIIEGVDLADIPAVLDGINKFMRRNAYPFTIRDPLLTRWGRIDPAAALAYAEKLKNVSQRDDAMRWVFYGWVQADLPAARAWAAQLPAGYLRQQVFRTVVEILAHTDPVAALDLCHETAGNCNWPNDVAVALEKFPFIQPSATTWDTTAIFIFRQWAEQDPQASATKAAEILSCPVRQQTFVAIAETWGETAPLAALAWAGSLTNSKTKRSILTAVTGRWAAVDPQAAAAYVLPLPDSRARNDAIARIAGRWASNDVTAALAWVRQLPDGPTKNQAIEGLRTHSWAPQDLPGMVAYAEALPVGTAKDKLVEIVGQQLTRQNPEEALRWVRSQLTGRALNRTLDFMVSILNWENPQQAAAIITSMPAGAERDSRINQTAASLAKQDLAAAIAWANQLPESSAIKQAWQGIAKQWAKDDLEAAAEYAVKLPAGVRQNALVEQVTTTWWQSDPPAALRWAQALTAGDRRTLAVFSVVSSWSAEEPEAAAAWVVKCPEGELRDLSMGGVVSRWARTDPAAAGEWLKTFPAGKSRDWGVENFMLNSSNYPEYAAAAVTLISDAKQRNLCIENLARQWLRSDPEAARKWLDTLDLPADQIERLLKSLPQR
jgi:hypothetical protein